MKIITSKDNLIYKSALKLTKKKYRDENGMYLLEGVKPLEDALSLGINIKNIFLCEGSEKSIQFPDSKTIVLDRKLFETLSDTRNSQGVIAAVEKTEYTAESFARKVSEDGANIVVLDRLQDPGNIGTVIRTAEAAGYRGVMLIAGSGDVYSPKVVRAAAGSLFRMPVIYMKNVQDAAKLLKQMDKHIVTTSLDTDMYYYDADLTNNIALVIGNEGQGVSGEFIESSDIKIKIPMAGSIESLNAAVAAGILMYQSQKIK